MYTSGALRFLYLFLWCAILTVPGVYVRTSHDADNSKMLQSLPTSVLE